jgi:hypothetical protein
MGRAKAVAGVTVLLSASLIAGSLRVKRTEAPALAGEVVPSGALAPLPVAIPPAAERASKAARAALARSKAKLDSTYAQTEHLEGLLHLMKALEAWDAQQRPMAAEELKSAADNLERGAKHGRLVLESRALAAVNRARGAARRLQQSGEIDDDEFWQATRELDVQLRSLGARIGYRP